MESVKCPGCNGTLMYDSEDEILRCNYCGNVCTIEQAELTAREFLADRLMDVHEAHCPDCGARLITDINTISASCVYCGGSVIYDEKVNKVFKPKKILLYDIGIDEAKEKLKKFLKAGKVKEPDKIVKSLKAVYLPFWLYNSKVFLEYEEDYKKYAAQTEYENILADSSLKISDVLTDKFDDDFDLTKLKDFELSLIAGQFAEEFDVTSKQVYGRVLRKIEEKARNDFKREITVRNTVDEKMYILLPFYYVEFYEKSVLNGYQILINGQNGNINIETNRTYVYKDVKMELPAEFYVIRLIAVFSLLILFIVSIGLLIVFAIGIGGARGKVAAGLGLIFLLLFSILPLYISVYPIIKNLYNDGYLFNMTEEKKKIYIQKHNRRKRY